MVQSLQDTNLANHTTFGVEAFCDRYLTYDDPKRDLPSLYGEGVFDEPFMHIGGGSNILFTRDFHGTIIDNILDRPAVDPSTGLVIAPAGTTMDDLIALTTEVGLWGLENLSGIPGKVGGCIVQNIGAYGTELKDTVVKVEYFDTATGEFHDASAEECRFGYRTSMFKEAAGRFIVTRVMLQLRSWGEPMLDYGATRLAVAATGLDASGLSPVDMRNLIIDLRDSKLPNPSVIGSGGSFFKNPVIDTDRYDRVVATARRLWGDEVSVPRYDLPDGGVKVPAAWFIDRCGWKGRHVGGAAVWEKQPLVLVNSDGHATAADILALRDAIIDDIKDKFSITLEPEVVIV